MKKLLRLRDLFFLTLAGGFDIFEEAKDPLGLQAHACKSLYGWVPNRYKRKNFYNLVWKSLKTGDIEKIVKNDKVYLRLSGRGKSKVIRDFPMAAFQNKKWDGKWRIVLFDIEEKSRRIRDLFRAKLKELGFQMVQKSVYITPHDITRDLQEFIKSKDLHNDVYLVETEHFLTGDPKNLANKLWGLDELNERYYRLLEKIEKLQLLLAAHDREFPAIANYGKTRVKKQAKVRSKTEKGMYKTEERMGKAEKGMRRKTIEKSAKKEIKDKTQAVREEFLSLLLSDSHLPRELLPSDWMREQVRQRLEKLPASL